MILPARTLVTHGQPDRELHNSLSDDGDYKTHEGLWTSEVVRNSPNSKNGEGMCSTDLDASRIEEVDSKGEGKEEEKK